jgi:hypothetical protein
VLTTRVRTTNRERTAGPRLLAAVALGATVLSACAPDDGADDDAEPEAGLEETDELESQAGDDFDAVDGVLLSVQPACAELGDDVEVLAEGLEPEAEYQLAFDPDPAPDDTFASTTTASADADGMLAFTATLDPDTGIERGDYQLAVTSTDPDGTDPDALPPPTELQIVDDLDDCSF